VVAEKDSGIAQQADWEDDEYSLAQQFRWLEEENEPEFDVEQQCLDTVDTRPEISPIYAPEEEEEQVPLYAPEEDQLNTAIEGDEIHEEKEETFIAPEYDEVPFYAPMDEEFLYVPEDNQVPEQVQIYEPNVEEPVVKQEEPVYTTPEKVQSPPVNVRALFSMKVLKTQQITPMPNFNAMRDEELNVGICLFIYQKSFFSNNSTSMASVQWEESEQLHS
jgi:hypothetical protein